MPLSMESGIFLWMVVKRSRSVSKRIVFISHGPKGVFSFGDMVFSSARIVSAVVDYLFWH